MTETIFIESEYFSVVYLSFYWKYDDNSIDSLQLLTWFTVAAEFDITAVLPKRPREIQRARDFVLRFSFLVSHSHENCMNVTPPS